MNDAKLIIRVKALNGEEREFTEEDNDMIGRAFDDAEEYVKCALVGRFNVEVDYE